jgi:CRISPR/Cas system-associated endonuclease Cas1
MTSSILPLSPVKAGLRAAQIEATEDAKKKFSMANAIVALRLINVKT